MHLRPNARGNFSCERELESWEARFGLSDMCDGREGVDAERNGGGARRDDKCKGLRMVEDGSPLGDGPYHPSAQHRRRHTRHRIPHR